MLNKYRHTFIVLFICLGIAFFPLTPSTDSQLKQMMGVTLSIYALARGLNGVISVAQGTELSIEPMGVGLTLAPGQILDPLNDLIEQFSTILLAASASLGIQQIVLFLSDQWAFRIGIVLLVLLTAIVILSPKVGFKQKRLLVKSVLFISILRLLIPVSVLFTSTLQGMMESQRDDAVKILENAQNEVETLTQREQQKPKGWFDSLKGKLDIEAKLQKVRQQADKAVHAAVYLLAEFVLLMLVMPLLMLWLLFKITTSLYQIKR